MNKFNKKEVNLIWINSQEIILEKKRKIKGVMNRHTKEEKEN